MASQSADETGGQTSAPQPPARGRRALLERHRWLVFVLPFAVYMIAGILEPAKPVAKVGPPPSADGQAATVEEQAAPPQPDEGREPPAKPWFTSPIPYQFYPLTYTIKILLTLAAIAFVLPGYRAFPCRVSPLAILVGAAGIIVWIGLCELQQKWVEPLGLKWLVAQGGRSIFDPYQAFAHQPAWMLWGFIAVRLAGMVVVVALVEEFFLRGFLMPFVMQADWWTVPFGRVNVAAVAVCVLYAILSHPGELFAAAAWFLLITLLMVKTKNLWDCVAAHAVTNLLLGIYVLALHDWRLW
jgi:CAAX prenyl protease-like protein